MSVIVVYHKHTQLSSRQVSRRCSTISRHTINLIMLVRTEHWLFIYHAHLAHLACLNYLGWMGHKMILFKDASLSETLVWMPKLDACPLGCMRQTRGQKTTMSNPSSYSGNSVICSVDTTGITFRSMPLRTLKKLFRSFSCTKPGTPSPA